MVFCVERKKKRTKKKLAEKCSKEGRETIGVLWEKKRNENRGRRYCLENQEEKRKRKRREKEKEKRGSLHKQECVSI